MYSDLASSPWSAVSTKAIPISIADASFPTSAMGNQGSAWKFFSATGKIPAACRLHPRMEKKHQHLMGADKVDFISISYSNSAISPTPKECYDRPRPAQWSPAMSSLSRWIYGQKNNNSNGKQTYIPSSNGLVCTYGHSPIGSELAYMRTRIWTISMRKVRSLVNCCYSGYAVSLRSP